MSRYDASLNLISVLDQLRDAYDLAKETGCPELQDRLMTARRQLMTAVHQSLNLHSQLADAQERLARMPEHGSTPEATARMSGPIPHSVPRRFS